VERYSRQVLALGLDLQERLSSLRVLIVGCGALGSSTAEILARMGVGEIKLVDPDVVELSNLHRTRIFTEETWANQRSWLVGITCLRSTVTSRSSQ